MATPPIISFDLLKLPVTVGLGGAVLAGLVSLYVYLSNIHLEAGHPRHEAQFESVKKESEDGISGVKTEMAGRLNEHDRQVEARIQLVEHSVYRTEDKLDYFLTRSEVGMPTGVLPRKEAQRREHFQQDGGQ